MKFVSMLLLIGSLAFTPSLSAQGFWDPPGEDPCDIPTNPPCFGQDASPGDAVGGAATEVGRAIHEGAEEDPVKGFILWVAETFGPNIPQPEESGSGNDSQESTSVPSSGTWVVSNKEFNANVRAYFDRYSEGQKFQIGATPPAGTTVSYTLTYKREDNRRVSQEYDLTVQMNIRGSDGKSYRHFLHILAEPGKVYFHSPKRRRKG